MTLVMTMMVRDEADVVGAMLEHHLAQGVDMIIVTDNASVDGTREIVESFLPTGRVELHDDPVHHKQQGVRVTEMARAAYTRHGADWVINADADEFWIASDPAMTLAEVFALLPRELGAFAVPVIDMIGAPARRGTGLQRLVYQDLRSPEQLFRIGLRAHATPDAVHVGSPEVTVSQGNHFVSIESTGQPEPALALEVRHFPWRSWEQYRRKVENTGRAYDGQTELKPSPNHHGMRDWRRLQAGSLLGYYLLRHPFLDTAPAPDEAAAQGLVLDTRIARLWPSPVADEAFDPAVAEPVYAMAQEAGALSGPLDAAREAEQAARGWAQESVQLRDAAVLRAEAAEAELDRVRARATALESELARTQQDLADIRNRRVVRVLDAASRTLRRG